MTEDAGVAEAFAELVENREAIILFQNAREQGFRVTVSHDPDGYIECGFSGKIDDKWDECGRVVAETLNDAARGAWEQAVIWQRTQQPGKTALTAFLQAGLFKTTSASWVPIPGAEVTFAIKTQRAVHVNAVAMETYPPNMGEFTSEYDLAIAIDGSLALIHNAGPVAMKDVWSWQHALTITSILPPGPHRVELLFRRNLTDGSPIASIEATPTYPLRLWVGL